MDPNYTLEDELNIIRDNIEDSALKSDYPDVDDYIPYRTNDYFISENADDYIQRVETDNNFIPNESIFAAKAPYLGQDREPEKYRVNVSENARKQMVDSIKQQDSKEQDDIGIKSLTIYKIVFSCVNLFYDLIKPVPYYYKQNKMEYYYTVLTKEQRPFSIIIILLFILLLIIINSSANS